MFLTDILNVKTLLLKTPTEKDFKIPSQVYIRVGEIEDGKERSVIGMERKK